jgi:galactitol-specific phosphotransferase system IIC component
MSEIHIINIDVMSEKKPDVMNVDVMCIFHMTFTFMTSVFFRYVSNSYDTSVIQT